MNVIEALIELQKVDDQIRRLEDEEKKIPNQIAQETTRLSGATAALRIAQDQLEDTRRRIKGDEAEAEEIRAKIERVKVGIPGIRSNKEYEQTNIQLETLERDARAAENRALSRMEGDMPNLEQRVKSAEARLAVDRGGVDDLVSDLNARLTEVRERLAGLRTARAEKFAAVQAIDATFLPYYERLSERRWPVVVSLGVGDVCDGCHMKQPPFVGQLVKHNAASAKNGGKMQRAVCTMCGRLLYSDL